MDEPENPCENNPGSTPAAVQLQWVLRTHRGREARWLHGSNRRLLGCSAGATPDTVSQVAFWPQQDRAGSWTCTAAKALQVGMAQGRWASADQALWFGLTATAALAGGAGT